MTPRRDGTEAERATEIRLPTRLAGKPAPIVLTFVRRSLRRWAGVVLTVVIGYEPLRRYGTDTFQIRTSEPDCAALADDLQALHDRRDVTLAPSLQNDLDSEQCIFFRAYDLEAEEISFVGVFRHGLHKSSRESIHDPRLQLDQKLSEFGWYQEEKELLGHSAWVIAFHGFRISRSELPAIIAKLREIAGPQ
jgi:hypothetical protein